MADCYQLSCTDCEFQTVVVGDYGTVIDEVEAHRRSQQAGPRDHFVNVCHIR